MLLGLSVSPDKVSLIGDREKEGNMEASWGGREREAATPTVQSRFSVEE